MSYADVNGISLYYEEHGSGRPLILLHGGYGTGEMYAPILPLLARDRRVIYADADAVRPAHIVDFYALLGGGLRDANWDGSARSAARLAILPSHTHYDISGSPDLAGAVIPFLDAASLEPPPPFGQ